jgi:hypothetical protein
MTEPFRTIVFVHGAGPQDHPVLMKRVLDEVLFGGPQGDRTRVAYYADVLRTPRDLPAGLERRQATDPVALAENREVSEEEFARALAGARPAALEATTDDGRVDLARAMVARADAVATDGIALEGRRFWDPGFRILVGLAVRDVIQYLYEGFADAVRDPVRETLAGVPDPVVVVAHSLGTIVAFDVLSEETFANRDVALVTLGSPLGIENVQDRLRDGAGQPHPIPHPIGQWHNLADPRDPVASGQAISGEFDPNGRIVDDLDVRNRSFLHHDLVEYLRIPAVRATVGVG